MARFLFLTLFSIMMYSCSDIFSTRDPEDPEGNTGNNYNESVSDLQINFKTSLLGLDPYLYESLFVNQVISEYSYTYMCEAYDTEASIFRDWSIENEKKFLTGLKASEFSISDIQIVSGPVDETADSTSLDSEYSMKITTPESEFYVTGSFIFDLIKIDGHFWYIRNWKDISSQGQISFSKLKEPYAF